MKKSLVILFGVIFFFTSIYFIWSLWFEKGAANLWDFVPENSALVYEGNDLGTTLIRLQDLELFQSITQIPSFIKLSDNISKIEDLIGFKSLYSFIDKTSGLISLHNTSKNEFDFLYVGEMNDLITPDEVVKFIEPLISKSERKKQSRNYLGFELNEVSLSFTDSRLTYSLYDNYFIASFTPYLVEDAIRTFGDINYKSFGKVFSKHKELTKIKKDDGNIYLNYKSFIKGTQAFATNDLDKAFLNSAFLDLNIENEHISLSGFSFADSNTTLQMIKGVNGAALDITEVISNSTMILEHFSFQDPYYWRDQQKNTQQLDLKSSHFDKSVIPRDALKFIGNEIGRAIQLRNEKKVPILIVECTNSEGFIQYLSAIAKQIPHQQSDQFFVEQYNEHIIQQLPIKNLPALLFGGIAKDLTDGYYSSFRNYVFISPNLPVLKDFLSDILTENTWGQALSKKKFLGKINKDSPYTIIANGAESWDYLFELMQPKWQNDFLMSEIIFKSFEYLSIQFSSIDDKYFTSIFVERNSPPSERNSTLTKTNTLEFNHHLISKPYLVTDHRNGNEEIIVQDSRKMIYLIDGNLQINWERPLHLPILGAINQIDFYKNKKLQYAFITNDSIYVIDRNGQNVDNFPKYIAPNLKSLEIIDYDQRKNYRFSITTEQGDAYITDKFGNLLEGWKPYSFEKGIIGSMRHFRIGGTDVYAVVLSNGDFLLLSRRAKIYNGFPIKLNLKIKSDYHLELGSDFKSSLWTVLSENGTLIQINLKGEIIHKTQLYKPKTDTQFILVNDSENKKYVIAKATKNKIIIVNDKDEIYFEKKISINEEVLIQFFNNGNRGDYIAINHIDDAYMRLFNLKGNLLPVATIPSTKPIEINNLGISGPKNIYIIDGKSFHAYTKPN